MKKRALLIASFTTLACLNYSAYCANTPNGEELGDIAEREADLDRKNLLVTGAYKELWKRYPIYSDTKKSENLKLPLDRESGLQIRLDPKKGTLNIEKKGFKQTFVFTAPQGTPRDICPDYSIKIIDASSTHAVIERICSIYEYKPNRFNEGVEYLLYDLPTATMQSIWMSSGDGTRPFPRPTPHPRLKKISNGYQLDWDAINPGNKRKFSMHTKYVRELNKKENKMELICTDLTASKEEEHGGACEGRELSLMRE